MEILVIKSQYSTSILGWYIVISMLCPGLDQACSIHFCDAVHHILDTHPNLKIVISWVPGHHNITSNDTADELAKKGSSDALVWPSYTTAAYAGNICHQTLQERWQNEWKEDTIHHCHSDFSSANKIAPTTNLPKCFKEPDRKSFSQGDTRTIASTLASELLKKAGDSI